ncbi:hypothetical protein NUW54_g7597 [Trametes sanguinea]|uniref:Uncharacterized protein n=1 Tax=Trametes sanguinea TaxID=158606 RepID=A0ACC1PLX1_9APHY|nr:hypothetical protein NUW54_g7597 [Trametes sanguinea]
MASAELLQANGIVPLPPRPPKGKKRASDIHDGRDDAGPSTSKRQREDPDVKPDPEDDEDDEDDVDEVTFLREQMSMLQRRLEEAEARAGPEWWSSEKYRPVRVPAASRPRGDRLDMTARGWSAILLEGGV